MPTDGSVINLSADDDRTFHGSSKFSTWPNCEIHYTVKIIGQADQRIIAKIIGPAEDCALKAPRVGSRNHLQRNHMSLVGGDFANKRHLLLITSGRLGSLTDTSLPLESSSSVI